MCTTDKFVFFLPFFLFKTCISKLNKTLRNKNTIWRVLVCNCLDVYLGWCCLTPCFRLACCCKVSILSSFESRLMQLENSIIPVHKQTENLQRLQDNVDKTLSCMDHVISYYHVAKDTDRIIREGWDVLLCQWMSGWLRECVMIPCVCVIVFQADRQTGWVSCLHSEDSESRGVLPGQQPRQPRTKHSGKVQMFTNVGNGWRYNHNHK